MAKKKRRAGRKPRPSAKVKTPVEKPTNEDRSADELGDAPETDPGHNETEVASGAEPSSEPPDDVAVSEPNEEQALIGADEARDTSDGAEEVNLSSGSDGNDAADADADVDPKEETAEADDVPDGTAADGDETDEVSEGENETEEKAAPGEESLENEGETDSELADVVGAGLVGEGVEVDESEVEDTEHYLKGLVEALLFSSDKPQSAREIARAAKLDKGRVQELVEQIMTDTKDRGVRLVEVSEGYAFRTNPAYSAYVREFLAQRPVRLSRAQLETLAIVAYRQPITRPEIDDIRGVDSGAVIKLLLERELVRILGKKDEPGRPMIYGTAPGFLDLFSLNSLRDLPTLREFTELSEDSRAKFEMEIGEPAPEGPIDLSEEEQAADSPDEVSGNSAEGDVESDDGGSADAEGADSESGDDEVEEANSDDTEAAESEPRDDEAEDADSEPTDGDLGETSQDDQVDSSETDLEGDSTDLEGDSEKERSAGDGVPLNEADEEEFPDDEDDDEDDDDDDDDD